VRPERMRFVPAGEAVLSGTIESANFLGGHVLYRVAADGARLLVRETGALRPVGANVGVTWSAVDAVALED
jgi:ABC-type Fe3+/spermidine/putrescine transport system ATPase subunit